MTLATLLSNKYALFNIKTRVARLTNINKCKMKTYPISYFTKAQTTCIQQISEPLYYSDIINFQGEQNNDQSVGQ